MRQEFGERILSIDPTTSSENTYRYEHQGERPDIGHPHITRIAITGTASPEGPSSRGSASIASGSIDQENVSLSEHRAQDMDPIVRDALHTLGIQPEVISSTSGVELQFTDQELSRLAGEAQRSGIDHTANDAESAYLLIQAYNEGTVSDPTTLHVLDEIVGSKRAVNIEVTYDGDQRQTLAVPLPFTLLLLFGLGFRYLKREKQSKDLVRERFAPVSEGDTVNGIGIEEQLGKRVVERTDASDPRYIARYNEVKEAAFRNYNVRARIFERLLVDEFNPYLGTKKDDIGYMNLVINHAGEKHPDPERFLQELTFEVLARWQRNDRIVRGRLATQEQTRRELAASKKWKRADLSGVPDVKKEYDYWQDPLKVMWAQETAKVLAHFIDTYQSSGRSAKGDLDGVYQELSRMIRSLQQDSHKPPARREENIRKGDAWNPNRSAGQDGFAYREPESI